MAFKFKLIVFILVIGFFSLNSSYCEDSFSESNSDKSSQAKIKKSENEFRKLCNKYLSDFRLYNSDKDQIEELIENDEVPLSEKKKIVSEILLKRGIASDVNLKSLKSLEEFEQEGEPYFVWNKIKENPELTDEDLEEIEEVMDDPDSTRSERISVIKRVALNRGIKCDGIAPDKKLQKTKLSMKPEYLWARAKENIRLFQSDKENIVKILSNLELDDSEKCSQIKVILDKRGIALE